jgi:Trypsin-co-occurring domain 1
MSMKLTEILAPDGSTIYIQYDEQESDDLQAVGYIDDIQARTERFRATMASTVRGYAQTVLNSVQQGITGVQNPSKVTLEFGLQTGGETGIPFVTKGTAQANVKVTIEWDLSQNQQP